MAALQRRPKLPTLHYYVGVVSEELGTAHDMEVAAREYALAIQYDPSHWEAHQRLGRLLTADPPLQLQFQDTSERLKKALFHYKRAAELKRDDWSVHYELGSLLLALNQTAEAKLHLLEATRLSPANSQAHSQLTHLYTALGQTQGVQASQTTPHKDQTSPDNGIPNR
jgi:Flp pilus assembly protein TadD